MHSSPTPSTCLLRLVCFLTMATKLSLGVASNLFSSFLFFLVPHYNLVEADRALRGTQLVQPRTSRAAPFGAFLHGWRRYLRYFAIDSDRQLVVIKDDTNKHD